VLFWILGLSFFVLTFVPHFYHYLNFEYGFLDLGLFAQALTYFQHLDFNPVIPTLARTVWEFRQQPVLVLLTPFAFLGDHGIFLIFFDVAVIFLSGAFCSRFARVRLQDQSWALFIFFAYLFSVFQFNSLNHPARGLLWAQLPLTLFLCEYFGKRRVKYITLWLFLLCLCDLHFCVFAAFAAILILFSERRRWNFRRRLIDSFGAGFVACSALWLLYSMNGKIIWETSWLWGKSTGPMFLSFAFLPLLSAEILLFGLILFMTKFGLVSLDFALMLPLAAVGSILIIGKIGPRLGGLHYLLKSVILITTLCLQFMAPYPFNEFWRYENRHVTPTNDSLHQFIGQIPKDIQIAVSDTLTPHFSSYLGMLSLLATSPYGTQPEYVLIVNENQKWEKNSQYKLLDKNLLSGARLFNRIK
jgi:hypothetical protein